MVDEIKKLLLGKNEQRRIVSIEPGDEWTEVFTEDENSVVSSHLVPNAYFILFNEKPSQRAVLLKGEQHYKWGMKYTTRESYLRNKTYFKQSDTYSVFNPKENFMIRTGYTYFKGMKHTEPSILSFDIETNQLQMDDKSKLFLISNTFRRNGKIEKKLFAYDEYSSEGEMIVAWCDWVKEKNPSIICGHNITTFDFPYLNNIASLNGVSLNLGRNDSDVVFDRFESKFRKEQNNFLKYNRISIYGREICDTLFLSIKSDIATKKYISYGLKNIIKQEGLEKQNRIFYDASKIRDNYLIPTEWEKIKQYCKDDSDDALALYDLLIAPYFYLTSYIPKNFQLMIESATGSQLNALLVRSYLQNGFSIPKADEIVKYEGAISWGNPGIWKNCFKIDINSLYPSLIRQYSVYPKSKDPQQHFLKMVDEMTEERFRNKKLAQDTNDRYYKNLEQSQKIVLNSSYGLLGANGLNFNSSKAAAFITRKGREILEYSIEWATGKQFKDWKQDNSDLEATLMADEERA